MTYVGLLVRLRMASVFSQTTFRTPNQTLQLLATRAVGLGLTVTAGTVVFSGFTFYRGKPSRVDLRSDKIMRVIGAARALN